MKKRTIIIIIVVSALLVVLCLWKSGVLSKKNTPAESGENNNGTDNINTLNDSELTNDEADRNGSFDDLSEVTDYGILNPNKQSR